MAKLLEICVDSLASARAAIAGGADRLELCSALLAGGLTPYEGLLRQIREESDINIRCLMRPRPGDFLYTPEELELMRRQILSLKAAGADGFVIGCLTADGFEGDLKECDEGDLQWVSREFLNDLPKWEGDQIFLDLLWQDAPFFLLTLRYSGDKLVEAVLDGKKIK